MNGRQTARDLGELLLRISATLEDALTEASKTESLSALEARLLRLLEDPVPQSQVAVRLGVDPSRVSVLTRRLGARGLVHMRRGRGDHRTRHAELSDEGRAVRARIGERLATRSPLNTLEAAEVNDLLLRLASLDPLDEVRP